MFSLPLFKQSVRSNRLIWTAITAVMTILCAQFAALEMTQSLLFIMFYGMMTKRSAAMMKKSIVQVGSVALPAYLCTTDDKFEIGNAEKTD